MELVQTIDDYGKPAWITLMIVGFILFWPIGLGILAYLIWSGRMGCKSRDWKGYAEKRWHRAQSTFRSTGNKAFDEYREETLRRLEGEADEFRAFMDRLREARDKAEFDQFMAERGQDGPGSQGGKHKGDENNGAVPQTG
jgi:hypothetical protein